MKKLALVLVLVFSFTLLVFANPSFDIIIKNGQIVDGTGNPWFYGDLGIKDDTIVEIGDLSGMNASKTIDVKGLVVSPGFIDIHTHSDRGLGKPGTNVNLNYITQGVTTVVTGNCGGSVSLNAAETKKNWEGQGIGTNAILFAGHGSIREAVMGMEGREATPEEIEKMKKILYEAMEAGAWGMSTGLEYAPGYYANIEELIALSKVVAEFGGMYTSHKRTEREYAPEAIEEMIRIGKEAGLRVNVSHLKRCGKNYWGTMGELVKLINDARAEGINITADMYPYNLASIGSLFGYIVFPENMEPLAELNKKRSDKNLPIEERNKFEESYIEELKKALSDPSKYALIKEATSKGTPPNLSYFVIWGWDSFTIVSAKKNTNLIGKIISDLAKEQKKDPFDIVADLFIEEGGDMFLSTGAMSEDDMKLAMMQDWLMFSSDGSAQVYTPGAIVHPRNYGTFPIVFRKYIREEGVLSLEDAVRMMTSLPASVLQLKNRGLLLEGYKADIVIFDPLTIRDNATLLDGQQYSTGIEYLIVNGKIAIENGKYTGALSGKLLLLTENK